MVRGVARSYPPLNLQVRTPRVVLAGATDDLLEGWLPAGPGPVIPGQPRDNRHMAERLEVQRAVAASAGENFVVLSAPRGHVAIDLSPISI